MNRTFTIAPSLLAADIANLEREIKEIESAGASLLHIDVMDGSFVPPITFGDNVVRAAKRSSTLVLESHLMIVRPWEHLKSFAEAGSDRIIIHREVDPHLHRTLGSIRELGISNGVAINPGTPVDTVLDVLELADVILVMTVNPGWGGQSFIPHCVRKIEALSAEIKRRGLNTLIEVDGGINETTARQCVEAGATLIVAGTSIFGQKNRKEAFALLQSCG